MSDIVERLRAAMSTGWTQEAADEIARLRASNAELRKALRLIASDGGVERDNDGLSAHDMRRVARAAVAKAAKKPQDRSPGAS